MSPSDTPPGHVPSGQENAALQPTATEGSLKRLWKRASLPYKARSSVMPDGAASQAAQETMKESKGPSIRWAPLNVGLERRLQTLVVLCHTLTIAILLTAFFFVCAIPLFWPIILPYLIYISLFSTAATSGDLSGRCDFLRSLGVWSIYASYFPARLHRSEPLLPTRKYIFGYHPHGIISHGAFAAFATEALGFARLFPGITNTLLTLDSNFRIPFYREYALGMGIASVSRESCENLLSKGGIDGEGMGRAITIVIGGARESLDALPHTLRLVLKRRKGFIKLAIHTGADLVPVLAFGENDLYEQVRSENHPVIHKLQMLVKHTLGFTIPLFHARGVFNYDVGLMPYRRPLNIVVGRPIHVVQQRDRGKIDDDYINHLHSLYVQELERIWEEWKDKYAKDRTSEIEIVA
ncbi:diacylglycerol acyltransferase type 2A [Aspergillus vadensis CBS 113365]|uniref:Diacylglycerol O-acyltransferase n=1 Tax=Aspergillus vadensis (strain CBS 113365 / IMI 142717 / IBT 24658) TaxID=1448311 RepID=A0A319C145_ASPVC|nr:diacylglycerol o-acyltransferase [Aspergillus vadensis CBS 113365]PYH71923.1 diacylglycerol o-acyltransferase [Aspergillus vadensis CBS 113365]